MGGRAGMTKYRYEFEAPPDFVKGYCHECPLSYTDSDYWLDVDFCVLGVNYEDCPLEEVGEGE